MSNKLNLAPLSGFLSLLPKEQAVFDEMKERIAETQKSFGFSQLDLPLVYREELLAAKAGGDTEKEIYRLEKGGEKLALRFDHTVPLAIYIAQNERALTFPFRVANIGKSYRGEKAQKGRFREFYQCDADIIARGELPLEYDAEIVRLIAAQMSALNIGDFMIKVSNRKLITGLLEYLRLSDKVKQATMRLIDKSDKLTPAGLREEMAKIGLLKEQIATLDRFIRFEELPELDNATYMEGKKELEFVMSLLQGVPAKIDLGIVRGLDYYTGTIFETVLLKYPEFGSICSGGRYDNLVANYHSEAFQGVGASIGLSRLYASLQENKLLPKDNATFDYCLLPLTSAETKCAFELADKLRAKGKVVTAIYGDKPLAKKIVQAEKLGAENIIVIGENEAKSRKFKVKNLLSGVEKSL